MKQSWQLLADWALTKGGYVPSAYSPSGDRLETELVGAWFFAAKLLKQGVVAEASTNQLREENYEC